jgi:hypothetical protein
MCIASSRLCRGLLALLIVIITMSVSLSPVSAAEHVDRSPVWDSGFSSPYCFGTDTGNISGYQPNSMGRTNYIVSRFIYCIRGSIEAVTFSSGNSVMKALSDLMFPVVAALSTLMIIVHGVKLLAGEGNGITSTMKLMFRLALVNFFFYNMGGFAEVPYRVMDELSGIVANNWTPWGDIDYLMGMLFGYQPGFDPGNSDFNPNNASMKLFNLTNNAHDVTHRVLKHGVLAVVAASVFSGTTGFAMASAAIMAILELVFFVLDIVYTYLVAVLVISLCIMVSPLMIPLALFQYADKYFDKWLKTMIGAILVPTLLFGFLNFALGLINSNIINVIDSLNPSGHYDNLGGSDFAPYAREDQAIGSWVQKTHGSYAKIMDDGVANATGKFNKNVPAFNPSMDSKTNNSTVTNSYSFWAINIAGGGNGPDRNMTQALFAFAQLWIYAFVLIGLIKKMPAIAQEIAGVAGSIGFSGGSVASRVNESVENIKMGSGAMIGGVAGKELASSAGAKGGAQTRSAEMGAIIGSMIGKRA